MLRVKLATAIAVGAAAWPAAAYGLPDQPSLLARTTPQVGQDMRSPDTRDAARELPPAAAESSSASPSRSGPSVSGDFEWGDAGIGAAVMLALMSVAAGTVFLVVRRRAPGRQADGLSG
jgi:hypothetical protein